MKRISTLLIVAALIVGTVGCGGGGTTKYSLTMAVAPSGGGNASDLNNASPYAPGTPVTIRARHAAYYQFVKWTASAGAFDDANAAETTFTMPARDVMVTANFVQTEPIPIWTWYDLDAIRNDLSGCYILMSDLNLTTPGYQELASPSANQGKGWEPIGISLPPPNGGHLFFTGTFDGQGYEIKNLFMNRSDEYDVGLFNIVDGFVTNVGVVNSTMSGGNLHVGGLAGANVGTVSNCYFVGNVTGCEYVGGLLGGNSGVVSNSYSSGIAIHSSESVWGIVTTGSIGGLIGQSGNYGGDCAVMDCYSSADVITDSNTFKAGGLIGANTGVVSNSYSTGSVGGGRQVGGLVGDNSYGIVSNSHYNYDEVLINGQNMITIGALFGEDFDQWLVNGKDLDVDERLSQQDGYYLINNINDFKQLLAFGQNESLEFRLGSDLSLDSESDLYIPYLAGKFDGNGYRISGLNFSFDSVFAVGLFGHLPPSGEVIGTSIEDVSITGHWFIGGVVGYNEGTIVDCSSSGSVTGYFVGGLVGTNRGSVSRSYSTGSVTGVIGSPWVGGLVGQSEGTVSNSYSLANVTGTYSAGGLVGDHFQYGTINNCFSTGMVTGGTYVGGLVTFNTGIVDNSFWDTQTSGQSTSAGGTGKTTAQMKDIITFSGATWDIVAVANPSTRNTSYVWNIVDDENYPFLSWEPV